MIIFCQSHNRGYPSKILIYSQGVLQYICIYFLNSINIFFIIYQHSFAYNNTIDLDDEDFTPIEDNNIAENFSPIPSNSSFENYSRASFSQHAQLREAANQHITKNRQMIYNLMEKRYKTKKTCVKFETW